jgi:hypothetical protein
VFFNKRPGDKKQEASFCGIALHSLLDATYFFWRAHTLRKSEEPFPKKIYSSLLILPLQSVSAAKATPSSVWYFSRWQGPSSLPPARE